jgi:alpha-glucosidase
VTSDQPWWKTATVYQIYPRSFCDADGDGVGDLQGITSRLDYLTWLGADAVWLSPFYRSPMADFGYDVANYTDVDPLFGTLEDFDRLLEEAHRRGLRVLVDWVPNHTSEEHSWFVESRRSRASASRDWYVWRDAASGGGPPNDWRSAFVRCGSAWTWDPPTGQYYLHTFRPQQPDLNWANPEVVAAMHATLRFWLDRGVDGFRIDAIGELGKDFVSGGGRGIDQMLPNWPSVLDLVRGFRKVIDAYHDRVIVGEITILDQKLLVDYLSAGDGLHLVHNFVLLHQPWDAARFRDVIDEFESLVTPDAWPCWLLNNHDNPRIASRYGADGRGAGRARAAGLVLLTLRGTPFLYQGEELGLHDSRVPPEAALDVDGRDPQRAPVPWVSPSVAGPGAGFTASSRPWLPVTDAAEAINVQTQAGDAASTLQLYRRILQARRRHPALRLGRYEPVATHHAVLGYLRHWSDERLLVLCNFSDGRVGPWPAAGGPPAHGRSRLVLSTSSERTAGEVGLAALQLEPQEGVLVHLVPQDRA